MWLKSIIVRVVYWLLPKKGKRIVFLVALYMKLNNIHGKEYQSLLVLNDKLNLVDDTQALYLPALLYPRIWDIVNISFRHKTENNGILDSNDIEGIVARIANSNYRLKKYGTVDELLSDIRKIIEFTLQENDGRLPVTTICAI